jgi:WbqC-like protein family
MQPYFFPYAGYFRLFAAVDTFIIYDCVQFPRRGRVHRVEVPGPSGAPEWLTLPLGYHRRDALIRDLRFAEHAREHFDERLARFEWVRAANGPHAGLIRDFLYAPLSSVVDYLEAGLRLVIDLIQIDAAIMRSSTLKLDPSLRGQARVIAAIQAAGATHYVNAPGGRALYDAATFRQAGIELAFLTPYDGRLRSMLFALMTESSTEVGDDVRATTHLAPP